MFYKTFERIMLFITGILKSLISKTNKKITSWQRDLTPLENLKLLS